MCHMHFLLEQSVLNSQNLFLICNSSKAYTWPLSFEYLLFLLNCEDCSKLSLTHAKKDRTIFTLATGSLFLWPNIKILDTKLYV